MGRDQLQERIAIRQQIRAVDRRIAALTTGVIRAPETVMWSDAWWDAYRTGLMLCIPCVAAGSVTFSHAALVYGITGAKLRAWTAAGGLAGYCAATPLMVRPYRYMPLPFAPQQRE